VTRVIVEKMTYGGAINAVETPGASIVGVEVDHDGLNSSALKTALEALKHRGVSRKYIYTTRPCRTHRHCHERGTAGEILGLSSEYGVPVFEDELLRGPWSGGHASAGDAPG